MRIFLWFLVIAVAMFGGVVYFASNSQQKDEDNQAKIAAAKEGTATIVAGGPPVADGNRKHANYMIDRCSTSVVDEGDTHAKVTFTFYTGGIYDAENVERDESGQWHSTGSNGGVVQSEAYTAYGKMPTN